MSETVLTEVSEVTPEVAMPEIRPRFSRLGAAQARLVAEIGRAGLVWLSLAVVYGSRQPLTDGAIVAVTLAASIWLVTLKAASTPDVLLFGRCITEGLGIAIGLAIVALLNGSSVGLHVEWPWLAAAALGVFATTLVWDGIVDNVLAAKRRVLFVGFDESDRLAQELRRCWHAGFEVCTNDSTPSDQHASTVQPIGMDELEQVVAAQHPDIVVLADEKTFGDALDRLLEARANVRVASLASFCEYALGRVPVEHISPAWFMSLLHLRRTEYTRRSKRVFDIAAGVTGLIVLAPLLAIMALLAKTTPGPVLHRQTRVGEGGRYFTVYKIRTMCCDAEHDGASFSCDNDPRVTRVGRVLRRTHLDELPQLWSVLKGDMSMVGPRPERPEFIEMIEAAVPFWNRRVLVKPGVTGWAQILGDYASDCDGMARKLSYDLWYLRHGSLLVDAAICLRTVGMQLRSLLPASCDLNRGGASRDSVSRPPAPGDPGDVSAAG
jgi:exopolysaccharide biosynthesis polyprenyl glycosylphosphotransferase